MLFSSRKPALALADYVDNLWLYEGYEGEHANERILPTGTMELVINLRENELRIYDADETDRCSRFSGAVVSGAYGKGFLSDTEEEAFLIGIHFKPGRAFPFLGLRADEISDTHIDLETLWGNYAKQLREQLHNAKDPQERFRLLEDGLLSHLSDSPENHYAVSTALELLSGENDISVRAIARNVGLSERRFIQLFKSEVGMTPKRFSRVQRFQRARAVIHSQEDGADWTGIAFECGYFDQSHFIREFREFSGMSPAAYLQHYHGVLEQHRHIKRYHVPLFSKLGQFYPIQQVSTDDIVRLGGSYVGKK